MRYTLSRFFNKWEMQERRRRLREKLVTNLQMKVTQLEKKLEEFSKKEK